MSDENVIMPYGKFKGERVTKLPSGYLYWVAANFENDHIATIADVEYQRRSDEHEHFDDD